MSELPRGWVDVTVEDVGTITSGFGFPDRFQGHTTGDLPFAKVRDISQANRHNGGLLTAAANYVSYSDLPFLKAKAVPAGSVAFAKIGEALKLNRRVLLGVEAVLDNNCMAITPQDGVISPRFLYRFMTTVDFAPFAVATTVPSIRKGDVGGIPLPLPPLAEQKRIVAKLDALNAKSARARTELSRIETLVSRYKQAVLSKAFSGELTREWRHLSLGDTLRHAQVGLVRSKEQQFTKGGAPYVRMNHFDLQGRWKLDDITYVEASGQELLQYTLQPGDVLFNTRNSFELVGKVAFWEGREESFLYNNNILRMRFDGSIDPKFAFYQMQSGSFRTYLESVKSATTSVCAIYQKSLMQAPFLAPGDLAQQHDVVRRIETAFTKVDRLAAEAKRAMNLLGKLDEAILAKAFRGKLVSQDEGDEPAEKLLERIRAERQAAPEAKRGRKKTA
ncbi:hypothetical protein HFO45_10030 [Rhizobium leguminosarum]|uniref:restriction endonuclease subunit S n=1 Tax=Rhizobium leguminosarum TaxID=384 RepID=UPI001C9451AC|nr:restriction endonuclease subunit S [Rhizobium leguminosarum]MBY5648592.1 hypothetical protein [Rhizobium leguminosarum]